MAAAAPGAAAGAVFSQAQLVSLLVNYAVKKGDAALRELQGRADSGEGINIKGIQIKVETVREALAKVAAQKKPPSAGSPSKPRTAASRWVPKASSFASLSARTSEDSEKIENFACKIRVTGGAKVAVLPKPSVATRPVDEQYVHPDTETDVIARVVSPKDGRVYLRLKNLSGWVSTRSRKEFSRTVLSAVDGQSLEPADFELPESLAKDLLQPADSQGRLLPPEREPQKFRAVAGRMLVISEPSITNGRTVPGAHINAKEQFTADAVHWNESEHRAYLRVQEGRGWVPERCRADIHRLAVEPLESAYAAPSTSVRRKMGSVAGNKKVFVVEHKEEKLAESFDTAKAKRAKELEDMRTAVTVYRSDEYIWPKSLGPPKPISVDTRRELSCLEQDYGAQIEECHADVKEVEAKIATYARGCAAKTSLQEHVDKLKKEVAKLEKDWVKAATEVLAGVPTSVVATTTTNEPVADVIPVQVMGEAWYCASIPSSEDPNAAAGTLLHLGPLRQAESAAVTDAERMRAFLKSGKRPAESESAPKRRRSSAKLAE